MEQEFFFAAKINDESKKMWDSMILHRNNLYCIVVIDNERLKIFKGLENSSDRNGCNRNI